MTRISHDRVCQLVESDPPQIVIADDVTGDEMTFSMEESMRLKSALEYLISTNWRLR